MVVLHSGGVAMGWGFHGVEVLEQVWLEKSVAEKVREPY